MSDKTTNTDEVFQHQKFKEAAAALGCANSISVFDEALLRIIQRPKEHRRAFRSAGDVDISPPDQVD